MKRMLPLLALSLVVLLLCACGKTPALEETSAAPTSEATTEADPIVRVMFPEGYTAIQIAEKLEENGVCPAADFMEAVKDVSAAQNSYSFLSGVDFSKRAYALEGYVFPDTYDFYRGESAEKALSRFLGNMNAKLTDERISRAKELGYTMDQIITLASIIQEECGDPSEMANVASVLHNRLESPDYGRLQCDVTIHYVNDCITDSPYLTGDTAHFAELYNTYKVRGLPEGAICCPGIDAIDAALYPAESNNFFFVTDEDMNYYYAATYAEHLENCKKCGIDV